MVDPAQPKITLSVRNLLAATAILLVVGIGGLVVFRSHNNPAAETPLLPPAPLAPLLPLDRALPIAASFLGVRPEKLTVVSGPERPWGNDPWPETTELTLLYGPQVSPQKVQLRIDGRAGCVRTARWDSTPESRQPKAGFKPPAELRQAAEKFLAAHMPVRGATATLIREWTNPVHRETYHNLVWNLATPQGEDRGRVSITVLSVDGRMDGYSYTPDPAYVRKPEITEQQAIALAWSKVNWTGSSTSLWRLSGAALQDTSRWTQPGWPVWVVGFQIPRPTSPAFPPRAGGGQTEVWIDGVTGKVLSQGF